MPHHRVLIIEDEPAIADALHFVLQGEGFACTHVSTLQAARTTLKDPFDIMVLDVGLPDGSGFDFCKEVRTSSDVPILFLTARQSEIDRIVGLEIGGDDYVTKPFSSREVAARLKAILRRGGGQQSPSDPPASDRNQAGAVVVVADLKRACALVRGQPVDLTRYELLLLHFLQTHPGRVFSRRQLMEALWEDPEASMERTVDAHIKTLRRKIPQAPIVTHRSFGYSWQDEP